MQHAFLAVLTVPIIWFAWRNFKLLGRLRSVDDTMTAQDRQAQQMRYVTRIVFCLLSLAILPFLLTVLLKST